MYSIKKDISITLRWLRLTQSSTVLETWWSNTSTTCILESGWLLEMLWSALLSMDKIKSQLDIGIMYVIVFFYPININKKKKSILLPDWDKKDSSFFLRSMTLSAWVSSIRNITGFWSFIPLMNVISTWKFKSLRIMLEWVRI